MGAEYYLFALFVFVLVLLLIILVLKGSKKNKSQEEKDLIEKEQKVMMLYFEVEDMLDGLKEYVESSREKIDGDIKRIETDMRALMTVKDVLAPPVEEAAEQDTEPAEDAPDTEDGPLGEPPLPFIETEGDVDRIAEKMNISKSEVALMLKMNAYKKLNEKNQQK